MWCVVPPPKKLKRWFECRWIWYITMTMTMTMLMSLMKATYLAKACSSTAGFSERNDRNKLAVLFNATFVWQIIFFEFFIYFDQTKERKSSSCAIWRPMWLNPEKNMSGFLKNVLNPEKTDFLKNVLQLWSLSFSTVCVEYGEYLQNICFVELKLDKFANLATSSFQCLLVT